MKKFYSLIFASIFTLLSITTSATTINVSVTNNAFTPATFSAAVGDVIVWTWNSSGVIHNVTSASGGIPSGAASFASGDMASGTFSYTITTAGNYGYTCTIHQLMGMAGGFNVTSVGISEPVTNLLTSAYPNPFNEKIIITCNGIESMDVFNVVGEKVKTIELSATENKIELDFADFPSGIYFYRTYRNKKIIETRKIIKLK